MRISPDAKEKEIADREKRVAALIESGIDAEHSDELYGLLKRRDNEIKIPSSSSALHRDNLARIDGKIEALRNNQPVQERRNKVQEDTMASNSNSNKTIEQLQRDLEAARGANLILAKQLAEAKTSRPTEPASPAIHRRGKVFSSETDMLAQSLGLESRDVEAFGADGIAGVHADGSIQMKNGQRVRSK